MLEDQTIHQIQDDYGDYIVNITRWVQHTLTSWGVSEDWIISVKFFVVLTFIIISIYILQFVTRRLLQFILEKIAKITRLTFLKHSVKNRLPHYLGLAVPYIFVREAIPILFYDFRFLIKPLIKATDIYLVFMIIWIIMALFKSFLDTLQGKENFKKKPMKSYEQIVQIILFLLGSIIIFSILTGISTSSVFAGMGAASAILLLIFKDSILGLVGSIQLSANDLVQIGDWITVNKYGADGNVQEINLTTVKVRNFDKTITTIPTYALISDSFQNWRGMQEGGSRRMKKAIFIKQSTIRFLSNEELENFKKIEGLTTYIEEKQKLYPASQGSGHVFNGFRLTNNDLFMQYAIAYLQHHPLINKELTLMVRQLAPTTTGLPIEIYTFTTTTVWVDYENIMTEIINHLISAVKYFDLTLFEESSGSDDYNVYMKSSAKNQD